MISLTAKKRIFDIEPYRPGKPIAEVKRELGLKSVIKLASNENPYGPSPKAIEAIRREAGNVNRYPDGGCFYLRQTLAKHLAVKPEQLIFGNGSDEIIVMAIKAFVGEGDEVVIAKPSFLIYEIASRIEGAVVKPVPLVDFRYDLAAMEKAVTPKTRMIFIGNPDNPAGTFVTAAQLADFLKNIRPDIFVFIDEAYFEYVTGGDYPDTLKLQKTHKNILVTRTFSKMYALAGLRVGYGIADPEVIEILNRVREPFNINSLAQAAAVACLNDQKYYRGIAKLVGEQRQFLYEQMRDAGLPFVPSATNFILIDVKQNGSNVAGRLLRKGVIVRDMGCWGLTKYIRVTIGTASENKRFIKTLKAILQEEA